MRKIFIFSLLLPFTFSLLASATAAQSRDYLTDAEVELVRDAQQMDKRIDILTRAVDRRFSLLGLNAGGSVPKKSEDWGPEPVGSRTELLSDIKKILNKAGDDIDNLASRPDSMVIEPTEGKKKPKGFNDVFPPAVKTLAAAAIRYRPIAAAELDKAKDRSEIGLLSSIIELCDAMIAAPALLDTIKH